MEHPETKNVLETIDILIEALERLYVVRDTVDESGFRVATSINNRAKKLDTITAKLIAKYYRQ